jgi:hypothetical protein
LGFQSAWELGGIYDVYVRSGRKGNVRKGTRIRDVV